MIMDVLQMKLLAHLVSFGKGRSGYVANSFAMRLNQLGKDASAIGEATTPSIKEHDLLMIISGSGSTEHLRLLVKRHIQLVLKLL